MRYVNRPPLLNSVPCASYAGKTAYNTKLNAYHANVPTTASRFNNPATPGQPTSSFSVAMPCSQPDCVDSGGAEKSLDGESRLGAGQPETSLQTKASA